MWFSLLTIGVRRILSFPTSSFGAFSLFSFSFFYLDCFFHLFVVSCLSFYLVKNAPSNVSSNSMVFLCSVACKTFVSSKGEISDEYLEYSKKDIFASNLSSKLSKTFSITVVSVNSSPNSQIWFTKHKNLFWKILDRFCIFHFQGFKLPYEIQNLHLHSSITSMELFLKQVTLQFHNS